MKQDIPKLKQSTIEKHEVKSNFLDQSEIESIAESEAVKFAEWIRENHDCAAYGGFQKRGTTSVYTVNVLYQLFKESTK